jgi:predicted RNase H-like nuclease
LIGIGDRTAEENLARHVAYKHAPRAKPVKPEDGAATLQRVVEAITNRIASGSLRPSMQAELVSELGTSRHSTNAAVELLVMAGTLNWTEATAATTRRAVVYAPHEVPLRAEATSGDATG